MRCYRLAAEEPTVFSPASPSKSKFRCGCSLSVFKIRKRPTPRVESHLSGNQQHSAGAESGPQMRSGEGGSDVVLLYYPAVLPVAPGLLSP